MQVKTLLISALTCCALCASGTLFAQGNGSGGGKSGGNGGAPAGNGSGADSTNVSGAGANGYPDQGASSGMSAHKSAKHRSSTKSHVKKPMNDTTNAPGADASSDTKGN